MESWTPLLEGQQAEQAWSVIEDIADDMASAELGPVEAGSAALFWAYATSAREDDRWEAHLDRALDQVAAQFSTPFANGSLAVGAAHVGFVAEHITGAGDDLNPCDELVASVVTAEPYDGHYDLLGGAAGIGVYFLERLLDDEPQQTALDGLGHVLARLELMSSRTADGLTWLTSGELLLPWEAELFPDGFYNLGVAHGVAGVIAFLARCATEPNTGPHRARATEMVMAAVDWLLAQDAPEGVARFGSSVRPDGAVVPVRSSWCYGDAGVANVLVGAGRRMQRDDWIEAGVAAMAARAELLPSAEGIHDVPLCHGMSSLMHMYNRVAQATGRDDLRQAALHFYRQTIAGRRPDAGAAGFPFFRGGEGPGGTDLWNASRNWLEGSAGVGLALIAAVSDDEPNWDRLLATDL